MPSATKIGPTTGPWTVSKDRVHEYKDGECWNVPVWANCAESGNKIAAYAFAKDREQARANAKLIAAAPDMVVRCRRLHQYLSSLRALKAVEGPSIDDEIETLGAILKAAL